MKQKDWFWCGAVLSALATFVFLQSIREPLYAGIAGALCALVSAILFSCGLRANEQGKSIAELKRMEEEKKQLEEQQQSYLFALNQIQESIATVSEEIQALREVVGGEGQLYSKTFDQILECLRQHSESGRIQMAESAQSICDLIIKQHENLCELLENHGKESISYYKQMIDQPWAELKALSEAHQTMSDNTDSILSNVESIQLDIAGQIKKVVDRLEEESRLLQEKLQHVCETLETQGRESRDAVEHVLQGYSDVTAQDIQVLTALVKDTGL